MISLQTMRNHKHLKWPIYFFFGLIIISFVFFYGWKSEAFERGRNVEFARIRSTDWNPLRRWVTIGPQQMKIAEVWLKRQKLQFLPPEIMRYLNTPRLRELISLDEKREEAANLILVERAARNVGISVTTEDIINMLRQQPGMSRQRLEFAANEDGFQDPMEYIEAMRQQMQADHLQSLVGQVAHASLFELWQEYSLGNAKLGLQLAAYPLKDFEGRVVVSDADMAEYLANNKERFHVPAKRQYAYVKLTKDELRGRVELDDNMLQVYYEQHQADFKHPAGVKTQELLLPVSMDTPATETQRLLALFADIRAEAVASDEWTSLAAQLTGTHPGLRFFSTESAWIGSDTSLYSPEYLKAVQALTDDRVSSPLLDHARVVIFRVKQRRQAAVPPLEEIRERVREAAVNQAVEQQFSDAYKLWVQAGRDTKQIGDFARTVGLRDELSTPVTAGATLIPGVGNLAGATGATDYLPTLQPGELSSPLKTADMLAVLQIRNQTEGYDPPLAEVRAEIEQSLRQEKSGELSRLAAQQNLEVVRGGADFTTALADAPVPPFQSQPMRRNEPVQGLGAPLLNFREQAASVKIGSMGMAPYGYDADRPLGHAIWKVTSIEEPAREQFAKERFEFGRQYLQIQQASVVKEWLADQRKMAEYHPILPKGDEE